MNRKQSAALRSFRRVREFLAAHAPADAPASFAKKVAELDEVMGAMAQEANEQNTGTRLTAGETRRQRALRDALWEDHMAPIAAVARSIYGVPGVKEELQLPGKSADNDRILAAAEGMANTVERAKAVFVDHGLNENFVDQLRAATAALRQVLVARDESNRRRTRATEAVRQHVRRGARAVQVLHGILLPMLRRNPDLKAAWERAKARVEPSGGATGAVAVSLVQPPPASETVQAA